MVGNAFVKFGENGILKILNDLDSAGRGRKRGKEEGGARRKEGQGGRGFKMRGKRGRGCRTLLCVGHPATVTSPRWVGLTAKRQSIPRRESVKWMDFAHLNSHTAMFILGVL